VNKYVGIRRCNTVIIHTVVGGDSESALAELKPEVVIFTTPHLTTIRKYEASVLSYA
jgi:hypothetical protein